MDRGREIDALVGFRARTSGTYAERRAGRHLEQRLSELGREARLEAIDSWPRWPLTYALHALAAVVGSVVSVGTPIAGTSIVAIAALLTVLDGALLLPTTRRLLGRRASQNVVSPEDGDKPGTLVLVAHYDAGRTGAVLARRWRPLAPLALLLWTMVAVLVCAALRIAGLEGSALTAVQFLPTVGLIAAIPLLLDVALSPPSPGANDNASGVAAALDLAERHGGRLRHFDVWVVLTGSQEALAPGVRAFLARHRATLDRARTVLLNVDEVGTGTVRYTRREGPLMAVRSQLQLVAAAEEIAEDDADAGAFGARALANHAPSDGYAARLAGYPALTVTCRDALDAVPGHHTAEDVAERIDAEALERAVGFCSELIERLDATVGPGLARD